jgi:hypothetical protein
MQSFLLDLWHDLREKKLWPVAALLVAAIAAVPFTLVKKEEPAPPPSSNSGTAGQGQTRTVKLPTVSLDSTAGTVPSKLQAFDTKRNPFKPLKDIAKADQAGGKDKTVDLGKSPSSSSGGSGSGSSGGSGSGSSGGSGSGSGTGSSTGSVVGPQVTYYTYRADISFGEPGHEKTTESVEKFSMLGEDKAPAAVYMGITDDTKYAVFAIDVANFAVAGEGDCKPADDDCQFVYLSTSEAGNETTITSTDGTLTYNLKLLKIKRVKLDAKSVETKPLSKTDGSKTAKTSEKGKDAGESPRPQSLFEVLSQSQPTTDATARTKK